jgi:aerobic-type carbon monoxide dehydrogenase small subunit (CoxS/CutS family)
VTDDQHAEGVPPSGGRWDPLPQGDYDDGATAFVKLPEGGIDALLSGDTPLAAPGHGYVPPQIAAAPTGDGADAWASPAGGAEWPVEQATPPTVGDDRFTYNPGATGQWSFEDHTAAPAPGHDVTGQWSIPVAGGDLPDESGEFTTSSLVEQWGRTPPATLPGGAPAPWATGATNGAGEPWGRQAAERQASDTPAYGHVTEQGAPHGAGHPAADPAPYAPPVAPAEPASEPSGAPGGAGDAQAAHEPVEAAHTPAEPPAGHGPGPVAPNASADSPTSDETAETGEAAHADDPGDADDASDRAREEAAAARAAHHPADAPEPEEIPPPPAEEHPLASFTLRVNGSDRPVTDAWIGESLLYVLRERLGLAGAKDGCSQGECGACNVQVDGRLVASCLVPAVTTAGSEIRTVEGLAVDGQPSDVQRALARCGAVQCGFCVPGMAMTVHDLLEGNPAPTELETRQALCGNLCRCSGYRGVLRAVQDVVAEREAHASGEAETDGDEARIPHQAGPGAGGVHPSAFENPAQPHPHDPVYGQGKDGGQA